MAAEWTSNLGAFIGASERAVKAGLIADAEAYNARVKERLLKGYTTGNFVTGANANAVTRGDPEATADGFQIAVGSTNDVYALPWEVGHHNLFTGKYERVEVWVPILMEMREQLVAIMAEEIRAIDGAL